MRELLILHEKVRSDSLKLIKTIGILNKAAAA